MADSTPDAERDAALRLAMARQHLAASAPLSMCPPWGELGGHERETSLIEARNWLRAADNAGLTKRHATPDAGALLERLRLIALVMHGLDGYADACEDSGRHDDAAMVRESVAEVRALLPESADPSAVTFEWALRFTSVTGQHFVYPMSEPEARDGVMSIAAESAVADRWAAVRRPVGPWTEAD